MRLVIHMGATKTGSTFLQRQLALNEKILLDYGIFLPMTGRRRGPNVNHHTIAWELVGDRRYHASDGSWDEMVAEINRSDAHIALISSEAFARLAGDAELRPRFVERLAALPHRVELIYVVREPLARINSMYTQSLKTFGSADGFKLYSAQAVGSGFYDLERSFSPWYTDDSLRFTALRFDDFVRVSPLAHLLDSLGVGIPHRVLSAPSGQLNVSPGPIAVAGIRLLGAAVRVADHGFSRRSHETALVTKLAQRRATRLGWFDDPYWGWSADRAAAAVDALAPSNERFARRVWGTAWPFSSPVEAPSTNIDIVDLGPAERRAVVAYATELLDRYLFLVRRRARVAQA